MHDADLSPSIEGLGAIATEERENKNHTPKPVITHPKHEPTIGLTGATYEGSHPTK